MGQHPTLRPTTRAVPLPTLRVLRAAERTAGADSIQPSAGVDEHDPQCADELIVQDHLGFVFRHQRVAKDAPACSLERDSNGARYREEARDGQRRFDLVETGTPARRPQPKQAGQHPRQEDFRNRGLETRVGQGYRFDWRRGRPLGFADADFDSDGHGTSG